MCKGIPGYYCTRDVVTGFCQALRPGCGRHLTGQAGAFFFFVRAKKMKQKETRGGGRKRGKVRQLSLIYVNLFYARENQYF